MKILGILPLILGAFFLFVSIRRRIRHECKFTADLGFASDQLIAKDILTGISIGLFAMTGIFLIELLLKSISIEGFNLISYKIFISILMLMIYAMFEEILFRGLIFGGLLRILRPWLALLLVSLLFGLAHADNPNANLISVISNALGGLMYAIAFLYTGSIWLSFGLHFSWNFFQGIIYGFPISGYLFDGLIKQTTTGPTWQTGGSYGPEGGVVGIIFRIVIIWLLYLYSKKRKAYFIEKK